MADVYDAVTADRPYKPATAPHVGVRVVREGSGSQFDPTVVAHFTRVAMPYPVGYSIALPDGRTGVVAAVDPERPDHPRIRYRDVDGRIVEEVIHLVDGAVHDSRFGDLPVTEREPPSETEPGSGAEADADPETAVPAGGSLRERPPTAVTG